jgi:thioesterase domain-containing protein
VRPPRPNAGARVDGLCDPCAVTSGPESRPAGARIEQSRTTDRSALVEIRSGSSASAPLFCVHAEAGDVSLYYGLASHLAAGVRVYGLPAPAGEGDAYRSLEQLAARHVHEIERAQPEGPYLIVGECTGGVLAFEIAQQLRAAGQPVALLALIDAFPCGQPPLARHVPRPLYRLAHRVQILGFHLHNLVRLGGPERSRYVKAKRARARAALTRRLAAVTHRSQPRASSRPTYARALAGYRPRPYAGSALVFRAARLPLGVATTRELGWAELIERVQLETVSGYFTTPISEPEVRTLAARLSHHLSRAQAH